MHCGDYRKKIITEAELKNLLAFDKMNELGEKGIPFFFLLNFDQTQVEVHRLEDLPEDISFSIKAKEYNPIAKLSAEIVDLKPKTDFDAYKTGFDGIMKEIFLGNSYLCNYSVSVPVEPTINLSEIYAHAIAEYKLKYKDEFVCFSPESFVKISGNTIATFPMKGTALYENEASLENLLNDKKEKSEHYTVVDLLRNDLSLVSDEVKVKRFRYPTYIKKKETDLVQLSSEIEGKLKDIYQNKFGDIFRKIMPAGSISGAPKNKTIDIINRFEQHERGFYTGVFGLFDGKTLDSAVCIRFIEKKDAELVYKTGGGLTNKSELEKEYQEIINKIYVPIS